MEKRKSPNSLDKFIESYNEFILSVAKKIVKNIEDAEDIRQEILIKIINQEEKLDQIEKFRGWIYRITYNFSLNYLREKKKFLYEDSINEEPLEEGDSDFLLHREEDYLKLANALNQCPSKYKIILKMYYFDGYSYKEISQILNLPMGTVKIQLSRAKKAVKAILKG